MRVALRVIGAALLAALLHAPRAASAHDVSYSYADLRWGRDRVELTVVVHRDDAAAALGIATPESLTTAPFLAHESDRLSGLILSRLHVALAGQELALRAERIEPRPERRGVSLVLAARVPAPGARLSVRAALFPENSQHETFLNVYDAHGRILAQEVLSADRPRADVYAAGAEGILAVLGVFIGTGIHHIFIGPDHILFLVGLLLLGGSLGRVVRVATSFTLAHSITLAVAVLGVVRVSGRIVEPMIALSVVYVGFENLRARPGAADWRTRIAFVFGLIHGFGFASVLREFGLPRSALAGSLLGFNLGVEIGQVCIVLVVVPLLAALRAWWPRVAPRALAVGSCVIVSVGCLWFLERILTPS